MRLEHIKFPCSQTTGWWLTDSTWKHTVAKLQLKSTIDARLSACKMHSQCDIAKWIWAVVNCMIGVFMSIAQFFDCTRKNSKNQHVQQFVSSRLHLNEIWHSAYVDVNILCTKYVSTIMLSALNNRNLIDKTLISDTKCFFLYNSNIHESANEALTACFVLGSKVHDQLNELKLQTACITVFK